MQLAVGRMTCRLRPVAVGQVVRGNGGNAAFGAIGDAEGMGFEWPISAGKRPFQRASKHGDLKQRLHLQITAKALGGIDVDQCAARRKQNSVASRVNNSGLIDVLPLTAFDCSDTDTLFVTNQP
jgi:hypothetical protein